MHLPPTKTKIQLDLKEAIGKKLDDLMKRIDIPPKCLFIWNKLKFHKHGLFNDPSHITNFFKYFGTFCSQGNPLTAEEIEKRCEMVEEGVVGDEHPSRDKVRYAPANFSRIPANGHKAYFRIDRECPIKGPFLEEMSTVDSKGRRILTVRKDWSHATCAHLPPYWGGKPQTMRGLVAAGLLAADAELPRKRKPKEFDPSTGKGKEQEDDEGRGSASQVSGWFLQYARQAPNQVRPTLLGPPMNDEFDDIPPS